MVPVMPMAASHMAGHPPLHERTESDSVNGDQMKMIRHQAEAENFDGMSDFGCTEQIEKGGIVGILMKDGGSAVATVQYVIDVTDAGTARNARYEASR